MQTNLWDRPSFVRRLNLLLAPSKPCSGAAIHLNEPELKNHLLNSLEQQAYGHMLLATLLIYRLRTAVAVSQAPLQHRLPSALGFWTV